MTDGMTGSLHLEFVADAQSPLAARFLELGRPYMIETDFRREVPDHEKFLRSILRRQGEPDRWLAIFMLAGTPVGFAHFKIDKEERPGWGYILEFYVTPESRRRKIGASAYSEIRHIMQAAGCHNVWLASHPAAESFWTACGFRESGRWERQKKIFELTS